MPFPPYTRGRYEQEARDADAEEVVAGCERHVGEAALEVDGERHRIGGEEGAQRSRDNTEKAEDGEDEVAAPEGPVLNTQTIMLACKHINNVLRVCVRLTHQRVIRIVRRLRDKQDLARLVVLECLSCDILRDAALPIIVVGVHEGGAGDVFEVVIVEDPEPHI